MNTTDPLGSIHAALDRYEAFGRQTTAELPPTRGAEMALMELGGAQPRFSLMTPPQLVRTNTRATKAACADASALLAALARVAPPPRPPVQRGVGWVGNYSPAARKKRIARFHGKRKRRVWTKSVQDDVRKNFADTRLRVKGRFVKKEDELLLKELVGIA